MPVNDVLAAANLSRRLMQPAADESFEREVKFESIPRQRYQMQGIVFESGTPRQFLRFDYASPAGTGLPPPNHRDEPEGVWRRLRGTTSSPAGARSLGHGVVREIGGVAAVYRLRGLFLQQRLPDRPGRRVAEVIGPDRPTADLSIEIPQVSVCAAGFFEGLEGAVAPDLVAGEADVGDALAGPRAAAEDRPPAPVFPDVVVVLDRGVVLCTQSASVAARLEPVVLHRDVGQQLGAGVALDEQDGVHLVGVGVVGVQVPVVAAD